MNDYSTLTNFISRLSSKETVVGILGLGYVGIPLASSVANAGFKVVGFDITQERVEQ